MDAVGRFWIRVRLLDEVTSCVVESESGLSVIEARTQRTEGRLEEIGASVKVNVRGGKIVVDGHPVNSEEVIILPDVPHIFRLNGDAYRGKLKLVVNTNSNSFDAINVAPVEPYLAGVVGAEMPNYWERSALEAQAIAARTYCLYIKEHFGRNRRWDVTKTQANQVYLGVAAESGTIWEAVNKTSGEVLVCTGADGRERLFPAYYSSTCGGHTESSRKIFGDFFEPLAGVPCRYCKDVARPRFFFWPMAEFDKRSASTKLLERYPKLKQLGTIIDVNPAKQSNYTEFSRLTSVKLVGSTGRSEFLRAEDLRLTIDPSGRKLRSTACRMVNTGEKLAFLSGRGYGHGVGMCQCGAQAMAREGNSARQILFYYYPGSKIVSLY
jgi:stage II sporulation protein D